MLATSRIALARAATRQTARTEVRRYATAGHNQGPSKTESQPQGSDQRGKTTTYILPAVAASLAVGAFAWLLTSGDKAATVGVGVNQQGAPDKLKSGAARRVEEGSSK